MENYEKMLEEAYKKVKPVQKTEYSERFEIPQVKGMIEGNKTIVTNFTQICSYLRRDCAHVLKFVLKELATPGLIEGERLVMQRKVPASKINEKIKQYVDEFVVCRECKKPDTNLEKQGEFMFMHCMACGAKHSVRAKI